MTVLLPIATDGSGISAASKLSGPQLLYELHLKRTSESSPTLGHISASITPLRDPKHVLASRSAPSSPGDGHTFQPHITCDTPEPQHGWPWRREGRPRRARRPGGSFCQTLSEQVWCSCCLFSKLITNIRGRDRQYWMVTGGAILAVLGTYYFWPSKAQRPTRGQVESALPNSPTK